jgi:uncharacterized membrane protein
MVEAANLMRPMRVLIWILGATSLINGIAMFFAPSMWFFRLVPGVPETGPFNAHLVADSGTFFIAVGIGLLIAGSDPARHVAVVIVAAIANLMHSILHLYSHAAGLLSLEHLGTEIVGIYLPTLALIAMAIILMRQGSRREVEVQTRAA